MLPTKLNLLRRDINMGNSIFPFFFNTDETLFHLFYSCDVTQLIWDHLLAGVASIYVGSIFH